MPAKYSKEEAAKGAKRAIDRYMGRPKKKPRKVCTCTNHMGSAKNLYQTKDAALRDIIRHHAWTGKTFRVYDCPTVRGFHITGERRK